MGLSLPTNSEPVTLMTHASKYSSIINMYTSNHRERIFIEILIYCSRFHRRAIATNSAIGNQADRSEHGRNFMGQTGIRWWSTIGRLQNCYQGREEDDVDGSRQSERRNTEIEYQGFTGEPYVPDQDLCQERSRSQRSFGV